MISFRSSAGISVDEMYSFAISKARSSKERSRQSDSHDWGREGICSGMNRPPSDASPFRTTSSNESYAEKEASVNRMNHPTFFFLLTPYSAPRVLRYLCERFADMIDASVGTWPIGLKAAEYRREADEEKSGSDESFWISPRGDPAIPNRA